jgi:acyl-coenzyme A thioesterase PaaI-like protein
MPPRATLLEAIRDGCLPHWLHDRRAQGELRLRSEGRVIHVGSRLATAEPRLTDGAGKLYAHAVGPCLVVAAR